MEFMSQIKQQKKDSVRIYKELVKVRDKFNNQVIE